MAKQIVFGSQLARELLQKDRVLVQLLGVEPGWDEYLATLKELNSIHIEMAPLEEKIKPLQRAEKRASARLDEIRAKWAKAGLNWLEAERAKGIERETVVNAEVGNG